jgi:glycosyltransferase involved in cell wall biosynthesis
MPFFSICIPNFNYEKYLAGTIESVLKQEFDDLEILVSDNCSTDGSVKLVQHLQASDCRIKLGQNKCNVGFAGNLRKASSMANGRWMSMLSSDDLLHQSCLKVYYRIIDYLGDRSERFVLSSGQDLIDSAGNKFDYIGVDWKLWAGAERDEQLSKIADADVWVLDAARLLCNSLLLLRTPFAFASTTYSRSIFDAVEGYCQGGIINPDKKFAWAILGKASYAVIIDKPLVSYRVHHQNQNSQQARSGALKHHVDQYVSTFQVDSDLLAKAGLKRDVLEQSFIEQDIALRGLAFLADGNVRLSKRILNFGRAAYPHHFVRNKKVWALTVLTFLGSFGALIARKGKKKYFEAWKKTQTLARYNRDNNYADT